MGLFSSKSRSTTNLYDYSTNTSQTSQIGSDSDNNKIILGNYTEAGITGDNMKNLLDSVTQLNQDTQKTTEKVFNEGTATIRDIYGATVDHMQETTEAAITETGKAYAESKSELRNVIDAIRPITLYAAIAATFFFIFKGGKK